MNEEKKVPFKWEFGEETISLQLGMYANNQRLYIGMITHIEDGAEPFADMTVNLPGYSLEPGEAFISGDISKDLLRFIKENKLGKVLPYQVQSGYGKYSAVAFDLEKLKAFDPKGVAEFRKQDQVEYLLDVLLFGETEEKAALITDYGKDVIQLEQRMAELAAADAARTKKHHERHAATPEH